MQITLIAEYEITYQTQGEPALSIFHLVRGREVVRLTASEVAELRTLLAVTEKRIRSLGHYQLLLGAAGDLTFHSPNGQRACYLSADHVPSLVRMLG